MGLTQRCTFYVLLMIPTHSGDVPFIFESRYYLLKYSQQCESDNITDIDDSTSMATLLIVSHSHAFSTSNVYQMEKSVVICLRQGRPMNEVISLEHGLMQ